MPNNVMSFQDLIKQRGRQLDSSGSEDDAPSNRQQDYYAGGESSGISIATPGNRDSPVQDIINRARANPHHVSNEPKPPSASFAGSSRSLYDDEPNGSDPRKAGESEQDITKVVIIFWKDAFTILRNGNPNDVIYSTFEQDSNGKRILEHVRRGIAPLREMGIPAGAPVDLVIDDAHISSTRSLSVEQRVRSVMYGTPADAGPSRFAGQSQTLTASPTSSSSRVSSDGWPEYPIDVGLPTTRLQIRYSEAGSSQRRVITVNKGSKLSEILSFLKRHANFQRALSGIPPRQVHPGGDVTVESAGLNDSVLTLQ